MTEKALNVAYLNLKIIIKKKHVLKMTVTNTKQ